MELAIDSYGSHTARSLEFIRRPPIIHLVPRTRRSNLMKAILTTLTKSKTIFAIVLALTIFGAVYGFAATLNVGANTLSAGNASVASCQQTGTPTGTYTIAYDTTAAAYKVASVVVTGLDGTNCAGKTVSVQLTNTGGTALVGTQ